VLIINGDEFTGELERAHKATTYLITHHHLAPAFSSPWACSDLLLLACHKKQEKNIRRKSNLSMYPSHSPLQLAAF
jgi:hypothetical protein